MSDIPADIMNAAEEALDNLLCNCVESCGGYNGVRKASIEDIAKAILAERERCAWIAEQYPVFFPFDEETHSGSGIILSAQCEASCDIAQFIRDPQVSDRQQPSPSSGS
jgi:hypothetical protein